MPDKQGVVLAEHYAQLRKQLGSRFDEADAAPPRMPQGGNYLVELFFVVNRNRQYVVAGMGDVLPLPLSDGVLLDYVTLNRVDLAPFEVELIKVLDQHYLRVVADKKSGESDG